MGLSFGLLILVTALVIVVLRCGPSYPRFGRWLDARIYAAFPRAGHLFVNDDVAPAEGDE